MTACPRCHRANLAGVTHRTSLGEPCSQVPRAPTLRCVADHADLVSGISTKWDQLTPIGVQHVPGIDDELGENAAYDLELANCSCGSTLARRIAVKATERAA